MSDSDDIADFNEEAQEQLVRNFEAEGKMILSNLLPKKSCARYEVVYEEFMNWHKASKITSITENVLLVYFDEVSKKIKPSTIWAKWSMLRTTLLHRNDLDISSFQKLKSFLKNFSKGYKAKQAKTLSGSEISRFLESSDDTHYLAVKTIMIFGICGATRCCELVNLKTTDVKDFGNYYSVDIRDSKNYYPRTFMICPPYYEIVKKYILLRPSDMDANRFFICYSKGKCVRQVMGKHKIAEVPKTVALYLNLENPELYTGHSLRRTSATLLSDSGASLVRIKNLGAWKSDAVAQRYIDHSKVTKKQNFDGILSSVNTASSGCTIMTPVKTSTVTSSSSKNPVDVLKSSTEETVLQQVDDSVESGRVSESSTVETVLQQADDSIESGRVSKSSTVETVLQQVDDSVESGRSSESVDKSLMQQMPLHSIENLEIIIESTSEQNGTNSEEGLLRVENTENVNSSSSTNKRKFDKLILDEENDVYDQHGPVHFYNCENITINFYKYSCSHDKCVQRKIFKNV